MASINVNKHNAERVNSTSDYIKKMSVGVDGLCERLVKNSQEFDHKVFFETLHNYIKNEDRLLYTNITNFVFDLKEEEIGVVQTNLDSVINYIYGDEFNEDFPWTPGAENQGNPYDRTKRTALKIWDHINLAKRQLFLLKMSDDDYTRIVDTKMKEEEARLTKELNIQLISFVAIFTALSFIVFGGISSLDNIFLGAKDIPVTKLMIVGTIWCFCIMNLVYVFIFFIAKLTELNMKSCQDVNANLVQKYPLIWWCNFVLIVILALSCWAYYIKCEGFSFGAYLALKQHPTAYFLAGTSVIILLSIGGAVKIYKLSKADLK